MRSEMYPMVVLPFLVIVIVGELQGHNDNQLAASHSRTPIEQRKALNDHHEIFGAKMYRTLFKVKHREQLSAVKSLMKMDEKSREKLLLDLMLSIVKVIDNAKGLIDRANFSVNDTFPDEDKSSLRNAIGNVVENTAFYSNLVLHFPTILLDKYKKDINWQLLFTWAYKFTKGVRLHDDAAEKLLDLAGQQLDIIPRRDDFHNPYDRKAVKEKIEREALRKMEEALRRKQEAKKMEHKKKKAKKPSLSKIEL